MKKTCTELEATWRAHLRRFDSALAARGMADKTRRAYGGDLGQLAGWAAAHDTGPDEIAARTIRRFAGVLSERGMSRATGAPKQVTHRAFYRHGVPGRHLARDTAEPWAT